MEKLKNIFWCVAGLLVIGAIGAFAVQAAPLMQTTPNNNASNNTPNTPAGQTLVNINVSDFSGLQGYSFWDANGMDVQELTIGQTYTFQLWTAPNYSANFVSVNGIQVALPYTFVAEANFDCYAQLDYVSNTPVGTVMPSVYGDGVMNYYFTWTNGQTVDMLAVGETYTLNFTLADGYTLNYVDRNAGFVLAEPYTFVCESYESFLINTTARTATNTNINVSNYDGFGGYITTDVNGNEVYTIYPGETYTFNFLTNEGFEISNPTVNGESITLPYTFVAGENFNFDCQMTQLYRVLNVNKIHENAGFASVKVYSDDMDTYGQEITDGKLYLGKMYRIEVTPISGHALAYLTIDGAIQSISSDGSVSYSYHASGGSWQFNIEYYTRNATETVTPTLTGNASFIVKDYITGEVVDTIYSNSVYNVTIKANDGYALTSINQGSERLWEYMTGDYVTTMTLIYVTGMADFFDVLTVEYNRPVATLDLVVPNYVDLVFTDIMGNVVTDLYAGESYTATINTDGTFHLTDWYVNDCYCNSNSCQFVAQDTNRIVVNAVAFVDFKVTAENCNVVIAYDSAGNMPAEYWINSDYYICATPADGYTITSATLNGETIDLSQPYQFTANLSSYEIVVVTTLVA